MMKKEDHENRQLKKIAMLAWTSNEGKKVILNGMLLWYERLFNIKSSYWTNLHAYFREIKWKLDEILNWDIIEKAKTDYMSPLVTVVKKDRSEVDSIQFCEMPSTQYNKFDSILLASAYNPNLCFFMYVSVLLFYLVNRLYEKFRRRWGDIFLKFSGWCNVPRI